LRRDACGQCARKLLQVRVCKTFSFNPKKQCALFEMSLLIRPSGRSNTGPGGNYRFTITRECCGGWGGGGAARRAGRRRQVIRIVTICGCRPETTLLKRSFWDN
jgi:hypothetical protein